MQINNNISHWGSKTIKSCLYYDYYSHSTVFASALIRSIIWMNERECVPMQHMHLVTAIGKMHCSFMSAPRRSYFSVSVSLCGCSDRVTARFHFKWNFHTKLYSAGNPSCLWSFSASVYIWDWSCCSFFLSRWYAILFLHSTSFSSFSFMFSFLHSPQLWMTGWHTRASLSI